MGLWRGILRWLGLRREARVQISAPGIEVTLTGEPRQVRALMVVIRTELERKVRRDRRLTKATAGQVVRPTELDEMDSPYALPEAVIVPVPEEERAAGRARRPAMTAQEPSIWPPTVPIGELQPSTEPSVPSTEHATFTIDDIDSVRTALSPHPSEGPTPPVAQAARAPRSQREIETIEVARHRPSPPRDPFE